MCRTGLGDTAAHGTRLDGFTSTLIAMSQGIQLPRADTLSVRFYGCGLQGPGFTKT